MANVNRRRRLLVLSVACGVLLNPLNTSMIAVALSRIQDHFSITFSALSWLISSYYIVSAIGQPLMGKLSDMFGRKRIFIIGLSLVTVASLLAPFSPGFGALMICRMVQALGSSALFPSGIGMIRSVITENQVKTLGVISVFSSTSAAIGPALGGWLIHYGDWPTIFLFNFPIIALSFSLALKVMPRDERPSPGAARLDYIGVVLFAATMLAWLLVFLSFQNGVSLWRLIAAVLLSLVFYRFEASRSAPFVDVRFLKANRNVTRVYVHFILVNVVFYALLFGMPSYLQQAKGLGDVEVGWIMLSISGGSMLVTPLAAKWIQAQGSARAPLIASSLMTLGGLLLMLPVTGASSTPFLFGMLTLLGVSAGINNLGLQATLFAHISSEQTGVASGLFMTARFTGTMVCSALLAVLFGGGMTNAAPSKLALICAIAGLAMLALSWRTPDGKRDKAKRQRKERSSAPSSSSH